MPYHIQRIAYTKAMIQALINVFRNILLLPIKTRAAEVERKILANHSLPPEAGSWD